MAGETIAVGCRRLNTKDARPDTVHRRELLVIQETSYGLDAYKCISTSVQSLFWTAR